MQGCFAHFWYRFRNWFRTKPGPGEPLRFLCGSEAELRRVTTWMCHLYPQMYTNDCSVTIRYIATSNRASGKPKILSFETLACNADVRKMLRMLKGCYFIFEHNEFSGTEWSRFIAPENIIHSPEHCVNPRQEGLSSIVGVYEKPIYLDCTINSPSAHERAEALLALEEWLEGKVSEQKKRDLLHLPDDCRK